MPIVLCKNVTRQFGDTLALQNVSFQIEEGEILGILGPIGAGKTTLLRCIIGLDTPTKGTIEVFGKHPIADHHSIAPRIGIQTQTPALIPRLTVAEHMRFFSTLYNRVVPWNDLLASLNLDTVKQTPVHRLTAPEQQKLSIGLSFLHQPELLVLDELTHSLSAEEHEEIWEAINLMCDYGTSVLLATRDLDEAEHRCDRVGIIDHGKCLAFGSAPSLIRGCVGESAAFLSLDQPLGQGPNIQELAGVTRIVQEGLSLTVYGQGGFVHRILAHLAAYGIQVTDLEITEPKFSDVFYNLTGRHIHEEQKAS